MSRGPGITDRELAARIRRLPDLRAIARERTARAGGDVYAVQDELAAEHETRGRAYVWSMPYRSPPEPCSTGEHHVGRVELRVVDPGARMLLPSGARLTLWEADLHEVEAHGRALSDDQRRFLLRLP